MAHLDIKVVVVVFDIVTNLLLNRFRGGFVRVHCWVAIRLARPELCQDRINVIYPSFQLGIRSLACPAGSTCFVGGSRVLVHPGGQPAGVLSRLEALMCLVCCTLAWCAFSGIVHVRHLY